MVKASGSRTVISPYLPVAHRATPLHPETSPPGGVEPLGADADASGVEHERSWLAVGMGLVALVGVTGTGRAEAAPAPLLDTVATTLTVDAAQSRSEAVVAGPATLRPAAPSTGAQAQHGLHLSAAHTNDSMRDVGGLLPPGMARPDGWADDDGWTAGFRLHAAATQGSKQWVASAGYDLLTQRGSYSSSPAYHGLRQDLAEVALQRNTRVAAGRDGQIVVDYGVGAGVQGIGPMGGLALQSFVHAQPGIFQGRLGPAEGLQATYTSQQVHVVPIVTAGVAVSQPWDAAGKVVGRQALQAVVPVGRGVAVARASAGVEVRPTSSWKLSATAYVDVASNSYAPLDFMPLAGARPGASAQVELTRFKHVQPYAGVSIGGVRGEPNYYLGVSVALGTGEAPRLAPLFK